MTMPGVSPSIHISAKNLLQLQQQFSLKPGQIIQGKVLDIQGNNLLLACSSTMIKARTEVRLRQGEKVRLMVASVTPNLIKLKLVPEGEPIKPGTVMLLKLGIEPQENLEEITQELLRYKLPVTSEGVMKIDGFLSRYNLERDLLPLLIWLKSVGINVSTKEDVAALRKLQSFFQGELSAKEEARFFQFLNQTENIMQGGYNISGWPLDKHHLYLITSTPRGEKLLPGNCTLILKVVSQSLDDLWFKIDYRQQRLQMSVVCSQEDYKSILEKEIYFLQDNLKHAGYQVGEMVVEVRKANTVFDFLPEPILDIKHINYIV